MPTGYTQPLHDGEDISFEQFALRCSRAMGAAIMQRDETLDVQIKLRTVDDYHLKNVAKAQEALATARLRTDTEWAAKQASTIQDARRYRDEYVTKRREIRARYEAMLSAVQSWVPPTDEHEGLKQFMADQIQGSIKFDCGDYTPSVPDELPLADYRARELGKLVEQLQREIQYLNDERERVDSQNQWVKALFDSLRGKE